MGTDITCFAEVKYNGKWRYIGTVDIDRNYELFAKMAGVRNYSDIECISQPRGYPEDIDEITKLIINAGHGSMEHSVSYLNHEQILKIIKEYKGSFNNFFLTSLSCFIDEYEGKSILYEGEIMETRIIFGFDC